MRVAALARRDALSVAERAAASRAIIDRALALPALGAARTVLAFCSFGSEVDTARFVTTVLARGKRLALPRIARERDCLVVHHVTEPARDLAPHAWGILEPRPETCPEVPPAELDFVLAPGVAFDRRLHRLGYGKAYYDRLLHACRVQGGNPCVVAAAFVVQLEPGVPVEPHDVAMDCIVTEREILPPEPAPD